MSIHKACGHDEGYHDPCSKCAVKAVRCTLRGGVEGSDKVAKQIRKAATKKAR